MNFKKIVASVAAAAVAVSAMAMSAFAITDYPDGYTLDLIAEGYNVTDVYGFTFNISGDIDSGVGGGVGFNSATTGWESHEWGNADAGKELNGSGGSVTFTKDAPVFQESDVTDPSNPYAQIWMQQWWGADVTIDSVVVLGADGVALEPTAPAETEAETEAAAEETEAAVEETEAPAETEAPVEETEAAVEETEAPAETEAPVEEVVEEAPAADVTTDAAATGNTAAVSIVAVMAVAGAAALVSKRK